MWINFILTFLQPPTGLLDFIYEWVLGATFPVCRAFKELMLSVMIRYLPGRRALIWIKATKIADISEVNTPFGSLWRKLDSRLPERYTPKSVAAPPFEPSVKNIDEEPNSDFADATNRELTEVSSCSTTS
jgi:hypothetical protein